MNEEKFELKIILSNHLKLISIPDELYQILVERLKFSNPKWLENQRMGRWNRGIPKMLTFYDTAGKDSLWIPRGYIRQLIYLCRELMVDYEFEDKRKSFPDVEFVFSGRLKPFQLNAARAMLLKEFGVLNSATGSGKTVIALFMIASRKQPALIVVHTKELAYQWLERIQSFLSISPDEVGLIGDGKRNIGRLITVALVQSLYKCADQVAKHTGYLIVDESHRCPSRTFTEAVSEFDSKYMLGLSATPWRRDGLSNLIFWYLGDIHHEVDKKKLIDSGHILKPEVVIRETEFVPLQDPVWQYSKMLAELTMDKERNHMIASDVARQVNENAGICLVLSDRKAHCEDLQALLKDNFKIPSEVFTGDLTGKERKQILELLNNGRINVIIATGQLMGEGFDCKNLTTLFLSTPIRFSGRVLQYVGRVLRPAPGKDRAIIFDYVDIKVDVLRTAARSRYAVYEGAMD